MNFETIDFNDPRFNSILQQMQAELGPSADISFNMDGLGGFESPPGLKAGESYSSEMSSNGDGETTWTWTVTHRDGTHTKITRVDRNGVKGEAHFLKLDGDAADSSGGARLEDTTNADTAKKESHDDKKNSNDSSINWADFNLECAIDADDIRKQFAYADTNGDGLIDEDELRESLIEAGISLASAEAFATQFFTIADVDNSGFVSFTEFLAEYKRMQAFKVVNAFQNHFDSIDTNHDGVLDRREVIDALVLQLGPRSGKSFADMLFRDVDADRSGSITMDELTQWYLTLEQVVHRMRDERRLALKNRWLCGVCFTYNQNGRMSCSSCGHQSPVIEKDNVDSTLGASSPASPTSSSSSSSYSSTTTSMVTTSNIKKAVRLARAKQRLLYVHIGRESCGNCAYMKAFYPEIADLKKFIFVDVDCDKKQWYYQRYNLSGGSLPFIVIADANDKVLSSTTGRLEKDEVERRIQSALVRGGAAGDQVPSKSLIPSHRVVAEDIAEAVRLARAQNKPIYVHIGRRTCGNCIAMKKYYPSIAEFKNMIYLEVDCSKEKWYYRRYGVRGGTLPFIVIATHDDQVLSSTQNYKSQAETRQAIQAALESTASNISDAKNSQGVTTHPTSSDFEQVEDIDSAVLRAKKEKKLLYLHIGTPNCGNCVYMKAFYSKIGEFSSFIFVDVNCNTDRWFYRRYNISGGSLPIIVVATPEDEVLLTTNGLREQNQVQTMLKDALVKSSESKFSGNETKQADTIVKRLKEYKSFENALEAAQSKGKLLYVHMGSAGCMNCLSMESYYSKLPDLRKFIYLNIEIDGNSMMKARQLWGVTGGRMPFVILAKPDHKVIGDIHYGFRTKKQTALALKKALMHTSSGNSGSDSKSSRISRNRASHSNTRNMNGSSSGGIGTDPASGTGNSIEDCLESHNNYRKIHGAQPLVWDSNCQKTAQKWADHMLKVNNMYHGGHSGMGQNLAWSSGRSLTCARATKMWYDEVTDPGYNFNSPGFSSGTGHFTQVVWKGSKKVGMGIAVGRGGTYVVAHYDPPGNYMSRFRQNVLPPQ